MARKTPLAWLQVTKEKTRLAVAVAGIAFACILIFMQLGFLDALFDGSTRPHHSFSADLVLAHPQQKTFFAPKSFARQRLYQCLGFEGVESVSGVHMGTLKWRNPVSGETRPILVFGVDPARRSFNLPGVSDNIDRIKPVGRVLFDRDSRPEYGPIGKLLSDSGQVDVELGGKKVKVSGLFRIGASFAADGTAITSDTTFGHLFDRKSGNDIEIGLVSLQKASDPAAVQEALRRAFKGEVAVYTPAQFADMEKDYWATSTGIGFVFGTGVVVGFLVGVVIVYQILYADVSDHLPEYATLKAMGYSDGHLLRVLLQQAIILACLGYLPGVLLALSLYEITKGVTLLPIAMSLSRAVLVFFLAVAMCSVSAAIAMRKLRTADPADIF